MEDKTRPSWIMVIQFTSNSLLSMEQGMDPKPNLSIWSKRNQVCVFLTSIIVSYLFAILVIACTNGHGRVSLLNCTSFVACFVIIIHCIVPFQCYTGNTNHYNTQSLIAVFLHTGDNLAPSQTEPRSMNVFPSTTTLTSNGKNEIPIGEH